MKGNWVLKCLYHVFLSMSREGISSLLLPRMAQASEAQKQAGDQKVETTTDLGI